jgi:hypothetical protein
MPRGIPYTFQSKRNSDSEFPFLWFVHTFYIGERILIAFCMKRTYCLLREWQRFFRIIQSDNAIVIII